MRVKELAFHEYYHKYLILEADMLTEKLKDAVSVKEDDCFALVTAYVHVSGELRFPVLSLGNAYDHCTKGLRRRTVLGEYTYDEVSELPCRIITPDLRVRAKGEAFLAAAECDLSEDLKLTRYDVRLDGIRTDGYPDLLRFGILTNRGIHVSRMNISGYEGLLITGTLAAEPEAEIGIHAGDRVWTMPFFVGEQYRLLMVLAGNELTDEQLAALNEIKEKGNVTGLGLAALTVRN